MSGRTPDETRRAAKPGPSAEALSGAEAAQLFERFFAGREKVLLAVSGGADSTALLVLAAEWAHKRDAPALSVATVDHGLRREAEAEIAAVAWIARDFDIEHARLEGSLPKATSRIEERARKQRYAALVERARAVGADAIATAHTLDDQAETVLMRLAAGTGPAGLAAMRPITAREGLTHLRPFLSVPKSRLVASLLARVRLWSEDAMNADPRFARARLRHGRAALEREGLTPSRLGTLAFRMARMNAAIEAAVDEAYGAHVANDGERWTVAAGAAGLSDEIKLRLLGRLIGAAGSGGKVRLDRLERLADRIVTRDSGAGTLAGARVAWGPDGAIVATREAPRREHGARRPPKV